MKFIADLHVHSKYSRATARDCDVFSLHHWAQKKGITVVGTGDFTHPAYFTELSESLVPAEPGLFRLRDDLAKKADEGVPASCRGEVRFILSVEISNIYKHDGATRKVHNLILMPDMESARKLSARLSAIGNIRSDGRPILGLSSRDLLALMLETSEEGIFIPAHVWTPWFSLLGSKSGYDAISDCYGDLSEHIHALETGLSSDPPMNWRVSGLDGRTLVSNSDAHSPSKLGREANLFDTELSYSAMARALTLGPAGGFAGTVEFFPEEGKYHLDGHRKCGVTFTPEETRAHRGICPECGKPLTLGVLTRVDALADRPEGERPARAAGFVSLVPLAEVMGQIFGVGPGSRKVEAAYEQTLAALGPELSILKDLSEEELDKAPPPLLSEAVRRMREGLVTLAGGYDGEYGVVSVFAPGEAERLLGQKVLFAMPAGEKKAGKKAKAAASPEAESCQTVLFPVPAPAKQSREAPALNEEQLEAVRAGIGPILVKAGPGTGKTRTLAYRVQYLVAEQGAAPESIAAVTFTNKAAREVRERIAALIPGAGSRVFTGTFHGLGLFLLSRRAEERGLPAPRVLGEDERGFYARQAIARAGQGKLNPDKALSLIAAAKEALWTPELAGVSPLFSEPWLPSIFSAYQEILAVQGLCDFEDLLYRSVRMLESEPLVRRKVRETFRHILVDEYQDINLAQHRLLSHLVPEGGSLFAIGDPDQAIYGFRGADPRYFASFGADHPRAREVSLVRNYRSGQEILDLAAAVLAGGNPAKARPLSAVSPEPASIYAYRAPSAAAEAEALAHTIESMVGGTSFFSMDSGRVGFAPEEAQVSFADFAVLTRINAQAEAVCEALDRLGVPFQRADSRDRAKEEASRRILSLLAAGSGTASDTDILRIISLSPLGLPPQAREAFSAFAAGRRMTLSHALDHARRLPVPGMDMAAQRVLVETLKGLRDLAEKKAGKGLAEKIRALAAAHGPWISEDALTLSRAVAELASFAEAYGDDFAALASDRALATDPDRLDLAADKVSIATVHAAKGLEWRCVFVLGCEEGVFPLAGGRFSDHDSEEERRLFYVAATRARSFLCLLSAGNRTWFGKKESFPPSSFLSSIPEEALLPLPRPEKRKKKAPAQLSLDFG
ncbi:MAG: UvrD-helicase domain-containing protein [Thermodesulfobacteriota bacterium]